MTARRPAAGRAAGFTLLEIAVSLAILGVGLVACMQIFGGALKLEDRAARTARAALFARNVMDELLASPVEMLGKVCGRGRQDEAEGFKAECKNTRYAEPGKEGTSDSDLGFESEYELRQLEVVVTWLEGAEPKTYRLDTLRMVPGNE